MNSSRSASRLIPLAPGDYEEEQRLSNSVTPYFVFALHTGFRWSKQMGLCWLDVDFLAMTLTIGKDKNGRTLSVPFNSAIEAVLLEMGTQRIRPNDPLEPVFPRR